MLLLIGQWSSALLQNLYEKWKKKKKIYLRVFTQCNTIRKPCRTARRLKFLWQHRVAVYGNFSMLFQKEKNQKKKQKTWLYCSLFVVSVNLLELTQSTWINYWKNIFEIFFLLTKEAFGNVCIMRFIAALYFFQFYKSFLRKWRKSVLRKWRKSKKIYKKLHFYKKIYFSLQIFL